MRQISIPPLDPFCGPAATPIAFIRAIVFAYHRYGKIPDNALRLAQIAPEKLDDPDSRVTAPQMEIMSAVAMQELDDEALGWFSRKLPWGSYGMLCRASITSIDLGLALRRWCRHHRLLTNDIVLDLIVDQSTATLTIEQNRELGELRELCLVTSLRYALGYACWAIDSRIPLFEASFPYTQPPHLGVYPFMFRCPIQFNSDLASVSFDAQYLSLPLHRNEGDLQLMLKRALRLTVLQYSRDRLLVQRVRQVLHTEADRYFTAETLAERLHVSTRTLHRQLHDEGASLQKLKDEARHDIAVSLLNRTTRSIKHVAQAVGFRNEKSFARAFKIWTGYSPSSFREKTTGEQRCEQSSHPESSVGVQGLRGNDDPRV